MSAAAVDGSRGMERYKEAFIEFLIETGALRFGEFTLKSGRISPYFFNAGQFSGGEEIERLGHYYACAVEALCEMPSILFGPAYKGIPLCVSTAIALRQHFNVEVHYCFDRKEVKTHGEAGSLVGKIPDDTDTLVMVDDVVTDGTTKAMAVARLKEVSDARILGLVIALDRKERNAEGSNAVAVLEQSIGVKIRSIVTIHDIIDYLRNRSIHGEILHTDETLRRIGDYLRRYGVEDEDGGGAGGRSQQ